MIEDSAYKARYRHRMLDIVLGDNNPYRKRIPIAERIQGYFPESNTHQITYQISFPILHCGQCLNIKEQII